jgi:ArsR family transcriptional regulator
MTDETILSQWAETLKAAAHPTRLRILVELLESPKCVSAMHELLEVRQTGISQHLAVLKHAGLVAFQRSGASRCYYLPKPALIGAVFKSLARDYRSISPEEARKRIDQALSKRLPKKTPEKTKGSRK